MYMPRNNITFPFYAGNIKSIACQSGNGADSVFDVHVLFTSKNLALYFNQMKVMPVNLRRKSSNDISFYFLVIKGITRK